MERCRKLEYLGNEGNKQQFMAMFLKILITRHTKIKYTNSCQFYVANLYMFMKIEKRA